MAIEKQVEALESELKLIKGEVKETLVSVRDFLVRFTPPPTPMDVALVSALTSVEQSQSTIKGELTLDSGGGQPQALDSFGGQPQPLDSGGGKPQPLDSGGGKPQPLESGGDQPQPLESGGDQPQTPSPQGAGRSPMEELMTQQDEDGMTQMEEIVTQQIDDGMLPMAQQMAQPMAQPMPQQAMEGVPPVEEPVLERGEEEETAMEEPVSRQGEEEEQPMEEPVYQQDKMPLEEMPQFRDEGALPVSKEETMMEEVVTPPTPQVNLLANLIRWVSVARRKLGTEQLPIFLEVYGISGNLSPELKEVILQLAEVVAEPSGDDNVADVWSQSVMELHGILTGGGTPLHLVSPFWGGEEDEAEVSKAMAEEDNAEVSETAVEEDDAKDKPVQLKGDRPVRLKLVVPIGDGVEKEFSVEEFNINLIPEMSGEDASD